MRSLVRLEKFSLEIKADSVSLNQRVPGSSPGAPTIVKSSTCGWSLMRHSDTWSQRGQRPRDCRFHASDPVRSVLRRGLQQPRPLLWSDRPPRRGDRRFPRGAIDRLDRPGRQATAPHVSFL